AVGTQKPNPEFTMREWDEAYADYEHAARLLEELVSEGAAQVGYEGDLDLTAPWRRVTRREAIREVTGVDILERRGDRDALHAAAAGRGFELDPDESWPKMVDSLLSKHVEPTLEKRTFVKD